MELFLLSILIIFSPKNLKRVKLFGLLICRMRFEVVVVVVVVIGIVVWLEYFILFFFIFFIFKKFYFIFKFYIIVLVLPNIKMNPPQVYMCSPP